MSDGAFAGVTRRRVSRWLGCMAAGLLGAAAGAGSDARKRKRRKKTVCPSGHQTCGQRCCSPDRECGGEGAGCRCTVQCGGVCCPVGQRCLDANLESCGCGQCPAGCACLAAVGGTQLCVVNACEDAVVQPCGSVYDCPAGTACFSGCNGRFCLRLCQD